MDGQEDLKNSKEGGIDDAEILRALTDILRDDSVKESESVSKQKIDIQDVMDEGSDFNVKRRSQVAAPHNALPSTCGDPKYENYIAPASPLK